MEITVEDVLGPVPGPRSADPEAAIETAKKMAAWKTEQERITALHEAGHVLVAIDAGATVGLVTIEPSDDDDGHVDLNLKRTDAYGRMRIAMAGALTEHRLEGEPLGNKVWNGEWNSDVDMAMRSAGKLLDKDAVLALSNAEAVVDTHNPDWFHIDSAREQFSLAFVAAIKFAGRRPKDAELPYYVMHHLEVFRLLHRAASDALAFLKRYESGLRALAQRLVAARTMTEDDLVELFEE